MNDYLDSLGKASWVSVRLVDGGRVSAVASRATTYTAGRAVRLSHRREPPRERLRRTRRQRAGTRAAADAPGGRPSLDGLDRVERRGDRRTGGGTNAGAHARDRGLPAAAARTAWLEGGGAGDREHAVAAVAHLAGDAGGGVATDGRAGGARRPGHSDRERRVLRQAHPARDSALRGQELLRDEEVAEARTARREELAGARIGLAGGDAAPAGATDGEAGVGTVARRRGGRRPETREPLPGQGLAACLTGIARAVSASSCAGAGAAGAPLSAYGDSVGPSFGLALPRLAAAGLGSAFDAFDDVLLRTAWSRPVFGLLPPASPRPWSSLPSLSRSCA